MADTSAATPVQQASGGDTRGADRWKPLFVVTLALLIAFSVFIIVMMATADTKSELQWQRQVFLFGAAEAIVFTAVGWLFGREVHRSEAVNARKDAEDAKATAAKANEAAKAASQEAATKAEEAAVERTKGEAVKAAVRSAVAAGGQPAGEGGAIPVGLDGGGGEPSPVSGLAGFVESLWPDQP